MSSTNDSAAPPPADPSALDRELAQEQAHVDRVYAQLQHAQADAENAAAHGNSLYQYDRADYAREEDSTAMYERDAFSFQAAKRLAILDSEHDGLVFGRLDHTDAEVRYIGRIGVRDDDYEPLVIDWRAPAAEPFYRATPAEPMTVTRRRVLRCHGEKVVGIEDDLLDSAGDQELVIIGEGALMAALSRARGVQMRDIVATIQSEQDQAIRAPYAGVTIISGGPGTGKTVVALHRAAYLLYSNRRRFENGGVLVVGPSGVFMNYIDRVLPSLGEDSVTLRAVGAVASDVIRLRPARGELERMDDALTARVKGSLIMATLIKRLVALPLVDDETVLRVVVKGEVFTLRPKALKRVRADVLSNHQYNKARGAAHNGLLSALWTLRPEDFPIDKDQFDDLACDAASFAMFMNAWWPLLTPEQVLLRLRDRDVAAQVAAGLLSDEEIDALVASFADLPDDGEGHPNWTVADVALLDEVFAKLGAAPPAADEDPTDFLLEGAGISEMVSVADTLRRTIEVDPDDEGHRTYAHVLVDEAQDVTPMQWRMLRRRGPQASWTIVGDPAQSSWPNDGETEQALRDLIGNAPRRNFRMSTNYRSPAEVFNLAGRVVQASFPRADLPKAVRSTGVHPALLSCAEPGLHEQLFAVLLEQAEQVAGTIAVVAPAARVGKLREACVARSEIDPDIDDLLARLSFITPLGVKGLEYDAVIVVAPDEIVAESPGGVRVLYVALTRPTQRLVTIDIAPDGSAGHWRKALETVAG